MSEIAYFNFRDLFSALFICFIFGLLYSDGTFLVSPCALSDTNLMSIIELILATVLTDDGKVIQK